MISRCELIIGLTKMKHKLINISYNPSFILEKGGDMCNAKLVHEYGRLPDGSDLQEKLNEIDKQIACCVKEMYSITKEIDELL